MSGREMSGFREIESERREYNRYVKLSECYKSTLQAMPDSLDDYKHKLDDIYRRHESLRYNAKTDVINAPEAVEDGSALFYSVLYRLNLSADIDSCKKAVAMLKDYLVDNPGSVMGTTMLEVIREQFDEPR